MWLGNMANFKLKFCYSKTHIVITTPTPQIKSILRSLKTPYPMVFATPWSNSGSLLSRESHLYCHDASTSWDDSFWLWRRRDHRVSDPVKIYIRAHCKVLWSLFLVRWHIKQHSLHFLITPQRLSWKRTLRMSSKSGTNNNYYE